VTAVRRYIKLTLTVIGVAFAGLQFISPAHTNPKTDESATLERVETVPAGVAHTLDVACRDCHSNDTRWRWYTYVAPMSWWTVGHVNDGRAELNFSVWGTYSARRQETRLRAICGLTETRKMPMPAYVLGHPDARLSEVEISELCAWTKQAISQSRAGARNHAAARSRPSDPWSPKATR
jgi:hypothetical protein